MPQQRKRMRNISQNKYLVKFGILLMILGLGCSKDKEFVVVKIKLICASPEFIDTLDYVFLGDNLPGAKLTRKEMRRTGIEDLLFGPKTRYVRKLKRSRDNCFYVDSVRRAEYGYFFINRKWEGVYSCALSRNNDFRSTERDTIEKVLCFDCETNSY
jgi:hypothetical protein